MSAKLIINTVLALVIVGMAYFLFRIIQDPIVFERGKTQRFEATKERLREVKRAQMAYRDLTGGFAKTWEDLIGSIKNDSIMKIKITGNPDLAAEDSTEVVIRDTMFVPMLTEYFSADYPIDSLQYIPFSNGKKFSIDAGKITVSRVEVPVFEVKVEEKVLLEGLNPGYIDPYNTLAVGSMTEASYNGNWE